jgi:hypothetical protein
MPEITRGIPGKNCLVFFNCEIKLFAFPMIVGDMDRDRHSTVDLNVLV